MKRDFLGGLEDIMVITKSDWTEETIFTENQSSTTRNVNGVGE
jgi:hypothetical protein